MEEEEEADNVASGNVKNEQFPSYQELLCNNGYIGSNIGVETSHESVGFDQNVLGRDSVSHFEFIQVGSPYRGQDQ